MATHFVVRLWGFAVEVWERVLIGASLEGSAVCASEGMGH